MTLKNHLYFWSALSVLFIAFVWLFKSVLLPFVLGGSIAYLLNPLVKRMSDMGIKRWASALIILSSFALLVVFMLVLIIPIAYREAIELVDALPGYIDRLWAAAMPYISVLQERLGDGDSVALRDMAQTHMGKAVSIGSGMLASLGNGGQAMISFFSIMVLTPLVAFFMMMEWDIITLWLDKQIPRRNYKVIKGLLVDIDRKISGFVRGQITIAFFLGLIYAVALTFAGLNFGFLIGMLAGLLSIIPMLGSSIGLISSIAVAWFQNGELSYVAIIAVIFIVGQIIEGNILTPKILGKSVGLHPLWILFSIMAGAAAFGVVGMLLAVPVVASVGVLTSFLLQQYRGSTYYKKPETFSKSKIKKPKQRKKTV